MGRLTRTVTWTALLTSLGAPSLLAQSAAPPLSQCTTAQAAAATLTGSATEERGVVARSSDARITITVPSSGCRVPLSLTDKWALPVATASAGWRVMAQALDNTTLLRIELRDSRGLFLRSSDVAAADQQLAVPIPTGAFAGSLEIRRLDLATDARTDPSVALTLSGEGLEGLATKGGSERESDRDAVFLGSLATSGQAFRTDLNTEDYRQLASLGVDYRGRVATSADVRKKAYQRVTDLIGRRMEPKRIEFATRSEPIVAFLGIAGLSRLVLLDCQAWPMPGKKIPLDKDLDCERLSEPWQTTFERARHFWVVYIEDEQTTFDTSIDVEFGGVRAPEYDDFDAQNILRLFDQAKSASDSSNATGLRRVRVGYRRFTLPTRLDVARITVSRQGSSYGLRSWSRSYARYGPSPIRLTGGLAVPGWAYSRDLVALRNVYAGDATSPSSVEIVDATKKQPVFAMMFLRLPQLRTAAEQSDRTWRSFFPDAGIGIALPKIDGESFRHQTFVFGASWPLGYADRVHVLAGFLRVSEAHDALPLGLRLQATTTLDDVRALKTKWRPIVGLSVDLARTP